MAARLIVCARTISASHPLPSFGRAALGLKGSVERGVVALQQVGRVANGRSLIYQAMAEGDLVGRKLGRPTEADAAFRRLLRVGSHIGGGHMTGPH